MRFSCGRGLPGGWQVRHRVTVVGRAAPGARLRRVSSDLHHRAERPIALARIGTGLLVIAVLAYGYLAQWPTGGSNPLNYFGYFTNQTNLLTAVVLMITGGIMLTGTRMPHWLSAVRAVAAACLLVVALVYNLVIPGTGTASAAVSAILHIVFPTLVALDWLLIGDRPQLAWSRVWIVLPYPLLWLVLVLVRGATDGWVPYGFLLPERGPATLSLHVLALLGTLLAAGSLVWLASRSPGLWLRRA